MSQQPELIEPLLHDQQKLLLELENDPLSYALQLKSQHLIDILNIKVHTYIEAVENLDRSRSLFNRKANTFALLRNSLQTALNRKKEQEKDKEASL